MVTFYHHTPLTHSPLPNERIHSDSPPAKGQAFRRMQLFSFRLMSAAVFLAAMAVLPGKADGQCSLPAALDGCNGTCPAPYPEVDNIITPNGRDDNYNVLIGGNLTVNDAAEMEGKVYIGGNLIMNRFSGYNMGYAGLGSGILPSNNTDWVTVAGDVNVPNFPAGYILGPDVAPDLLGNFVYGGFLSPFDLDGLFPDVVNFASEANTPTNTAPFDEMFEQLAAISACLGAKNQSSVSDITFVDNGGGTYTITEVSEADVYIINLSSNLSGATLNFVGFEGDETIVFNVDLPGSGDAVTLDIAGTQRNGSPAGEGASSGTVAFSLREGILWNFPDASSVTISGGQFQGSVLVPGATASVTMSAGGLNGRFWVEGNVIHGGSGSEFHAFPFRGNLPLTCCDYGDLPDLTSSTGAGDYQTQLANNGPRHLVDNTLRMGALVDGEGDGQQSAIADGDDTNTDDEDGIAAFPTFYAGQTANITASVTNTTGSQATLYGWIDFNNDGQLDNATERASVSVPSGGTGNVTLTFSVPGGAVTSTDLGARFRLSTDPDAANATGSADDGEVEDYIVQIQPPLVCNVSISDVQVSGCTYNIAAGESQATVTVEVSWTNPPAGENIFVSIGAQSRFIDVVGGATSPATVSFTVLADGSSGNAINVAFSGNTCTGSSSYDAPAACTPVGCLLQIVEVGVGECVNNATTGNVPTALVSVQVDWVNQPPGSLIEVTFDGQTKTINPNSNGNPKYVQFMANLNSATPSGMVTAQFAPGACNVASAPYVLPAACSPTTPCAGPNAIGGNVFTDFDSDGKKDASEFGLEGITVDIFDCTGNLLCTTTTDFNGDWTCTGLTNGEEVRIEFYNYPYPYVPAAADDNNQSGRTNDGGSVQFATVGSDCQADFGLINISEFCENNPFLILPCWVRGNPLQPGTSAGMPVMVAVPYQAAGNQQQNNVQHSYLATNAEIGPTWGVAYNRNTKTIFASALLRRHSGWGPDSLSSIYKIDVSQVPAPSITGNSSLYVDLDAQFGIDAADEYTITRDLSPNLTVPSYDPQVFDLVGKAGFGDIDISSDFDSIFVVNLYSRSLVIIQNDPNTDTPLSATEIAIPNPNCQGGASDWRPWALKYHKGVIYVGGVCSGQANQNDQQMIGVVYAFDPITSSFTELISFDLDYPKGSPASWLGNPSADCKNWNPWTANFSDLIESGVELCYPQPILTDIEFDVYGNMTLGFVDRMGLQGGWFDYDTSPPTSQAYKSNLGGDILRVFNNNGHYLLEKDAVAGYTTGCGSTQPSPGQGPGGGEFYCQDAFGSAHEETAQGGLALHPSNNEIVTAVMDPLGAFSAGLAWYNNGTGVSTRQYEVYYSGNSGTTGLFGKAAGLGDLELTCSEPSQQIGNYVFIDENINGVQDACDTPVAGIEVSLYSTSGTLIATTTTDADGYYYFNTYDGITPVTDYYIVFGTNGEWSGTTLNYLGDAYSLTLANVGAGPRPDLNDSDVSIAGGALPPAIQGFPYILATTPIEGTSDHSFDAGFILPSFSVGSTVFLDINEDGVQNGGEPGLQNITVELYQAGDVPGVDAPLASDVTDANGDYYFGSLLAGNYFVYLPAPPGIAPASSPGAGVADSDTDANDDGIQAAFGGSAQSGVFTLSFGNEPVDGAGETGQGNTQDNADDANGNMTIDFGFVPAVSVGSTVFYDQNNNGIHDGGEPGIDGVTVQLYSVGPDGQLNTMDDVLIDTDITTGGGNYFFFGLPQGNYYLVIPTPPADYSLSSTTDELDPNSDVDENDNGLQPGGAGTAVRSGIITLTVNGEPVNGAGESGPGSSEDDFDDNNGNSTVDFGFIPAVSVGSLVFADLENNGLFDGADFGIDGVEVELWSTGADGNKGTSDDVYVAADITSGGGIYYIGNLPQGEYYLKIQSTQFGAGQALEAYALSSTDIPSSGTDNSTDNDDNGLQMNGAGGMVMSPEFILEPNTEPAGEPGPGGAQDAGDDDNGDMTKDFGFSPVVSIGSTVFSDIDNDGQYEPQDGENGIPGVVVEVWSTGPDGDKGTADDVLSGSDITDSNGDYFLGGLFPGEYYVVIPASEFAAGEPLHGQPWSSIPTDTNDNGEDNDDNGIQMGGQGTMVMSPEIILAATTEPVAPAESGSGSTQDDSADANGDMTVDFGFVPSVSVGSLVWADLNNNGLYEPSESGIDGVEVQLWSPGPDGTKGGGDDAQIQTGADGILGTADDVAAAPVVTAGGGLYYFGNLLPGSYYVAIPNPDAAYPLSSTPTDTNANNQEDNDDNGIQDGGFGTMAMSNIFMLQAGTEPMGESGPGGDQDAADDDNGDMTIDFGFIPGMSVGSHVFADLDNNGLYDGADFGIDGVEVELWSTGPDGDKGTADDVLVATDITTGGGIYFFDNLPQGEYYLKIQSTQFGAGEALEAYPLSSADIASSGTDNATDNDDNGLQMGGAGGMVMSPEFILEANTEPNTEPGPGGAQDNSDDDNGDMTKDFGFTPAVSIGSTVFADIDNDGLYEPQDGENGIPGVLVQVWSTGPDGDKGTADDALVGSDITDSNGDYYIGGLYEGEYYVLIPASEFGSGEPLETLQWSSTPTDTNDNGEDDDDNGIQMAGPGSMVMSPEIILAAGTEPVAPAEDGSGSTQDDAADANGDMTVDFGFVPGVSVGSLVFADEDNNGLYDGADSGIDGVEVQLWNPGPDGTKGGGDDVQVVTGADGILGTADDLAAAPVVTAGGGLYYFGNLLPGNYYIVIPAPDVDYPLSSTPTDTDANNGEDNDDNGIQAGGLGTMTMSSVFELSVAAEPMGESGPGGDQDAADDDNGDMTIDFGFIPAMSVGSHVFADLDNNGLYDGADFGIDGVEVELWSTGPDGDKGTADDALVATDVTTGGGIYYFDALLEGEYYLKIQSTQFGAGEALEAYPLSSADIASSGTDNATDNDDNGLQMGGAGGMVMSPEFILESNTEPNTEPGPGGAQDNSDDDNGDMTKDFGFTPAVSVGSTVFLDEDNDGIQDLNEPGIPGVVLELYDAGPDKLIGTADDGGLVASTTTNSVGDYYFGGLYEGNYYIQVPASQFGTGMSLENAPLSSVITDTNDNQQDFDDNGSQTLQGTTTTSPVFMLMAGTEPVDGAEDAQGGTQDDARDANGDMTIDFGFVPIHFDLALIKQLSAGQSNMVEPGDDVSYTITVINQGNVAADNITVTDYVPVGMSFNPALNPGWSLNGNGDPQTVVTIPGGLLPGATTTVGITLSVNAPLSSGTTLVNVAEISDATDFQGIPHVDEDSTPDDVENNDTYLNDDEINGDGKNGGDEDDSDAEEIIVEPFDLALVKLLANGQSPMVEPGDDVSYVIQVINQGMIPADNIVVTDYLPAGMSFNPGLNPGWALNGNGDPQTTISINGGLQPGASASVSIILTVNDPLPAGTSLVNLAEISGATDEDGNPVEDIDSTPDEVGDNDTYLQDNDVSGDGNDGEDEDDSDPAEVIVEPFDLALTKTLANGQSNMVEPGDNVMYTIRVYNQGMIPADNIVITDYVPAGMAFNPALNFGWALNGNGDPAITMSDANNRLPAGGLAPGTSISVNIILTVNSPLPAGTSLVNFAEISGATDEDGNAVQDIDSTPDDVENNDTYLVDNEVNGNATTGGDEDDHDPAEVIVEPFDLALVKQLANGQPGMVEPGDNVTFTIRVINQGLIPADNIVVTDYVPAGMTFNPALNPGWSLNGNGDPSRTITVAGGLQPGASRTVNIVLTVDAPLASGTELVNFAEISGATDEDGNPVQDIDSTPDDVDNNDTYLVDNYVSGDANEGEDEDDHDPASVIIEPFDLALVKELANGQGAMVEPGDDVAFTITVINQGLIPADNIAITDYVPAGMTFNPALNPGWSPNGNGDPGTTLTIAGGLQPGASTSVNIILTVDDPLMAGLTLVNFAEISGATDEDGNAVQDIDSTPDDVDDNDTYLSDNNTSGNGNEGEDEDDHDPAQVTIEAFDLALVKTLAPGQSYLVEPGDNVAYAIEVINQGMIPADNIEITDYVPIGMTFNPALNPAWGTNGNGDPFTVLSIVGGLLPGQSITVNIILTVDAPLASGTNLVNFAEISGATDEDGNAVQDIDSTPDDVDGNDTYLSDNDVSGNGNEGEDEDDHDQATIVVKPFDLALVKVLSAGQSASVEPGDDVSFTVRVINQGQIPADNIVITDYMPAGMTFNPALNPGWSLNGNGDPQTTITVAGGLQPGTSTAVDIILTVDDPLSAGLMLVNFAEISGATDEDGNPVQDVDSTPDDVDGNDTYLVDNSVSGNSLQGDDEDDHDPATVIVEAFDLALVKQLGPNQASMVEPGDDVTFAITVINQGMIPADNIVITDYVPTGMAFNPALNPGWSLNGNGSPATTLTIAGGLQPGASMTVNIILTVNDPLAAGTSLLNFAEITDATDEDGNAVEDIDSTPDDIDDNDTFLSDNDVSGNGNEGEDEDDHDVAEVIVEPFDLALYKELGAGQPATVEPGDTVLFTITVVNQGMIPADNIEVVDYVPSGMSFDAPLNAGWALNGNGDPATTLTIAGGLQPGATTTVDIYLVVDAPLAAGTSLVNFAEIVAATDEDGNAVQDIDSTPDDTDDNDTYLQDNNIDGNGLNGGDEDDHDAATVTVESFDLALVKLLGDGQSNLVQPGDTVAFKIRVINQGMIAADNILVTDYLPSGLNFDGTISGNAGWAISGALVQRTISVAAGDLPTGGLAPTDSVEVSLYLVLDSPIPAGATIQNVAEISAATDEFGNPQQDVDSTPNDNPDDDNYLQDNEVSGDGNDGEDEDDHDVEVIGILPFDLALYKVLGNGEDALVEPGDTVIFTITVVNQGAIIANNITVTDYMPAGMSFDPSLNAGWALNGNGDPEFTMVLPSGLQPGKSQSVDIALVIDAPLPAGLQLVNFAEITAATDENGGPQQDVDSTPDDVDDNDLYLEDNYIDGNGFAGGDEDDHDPAMVTVEAFDLALYKELGLGQSATVEPGDTVLFTITVVNQGEIAADNIEVVDYVPAGMSFDATLNAGWALNGNGDAATTLAIAGGLQPGAATTVDIYLVVDAPLAAGTSLVNYAEIAGATDENGGPQQDVDSTPDDNGDNDIYTQDNYIGGDGNQGEDEDDHDPATVTVEAFDLALMKLLGNGQSASVQPGDTVHYTLRVINQGMIAADNIVVSDYVPVAMSFESGIAGNAGWSEVAAGLVQRTLSVANGGLPAGGLLPGQDIEVSLYLTLSSPLPAGTQVDNYGEISSATDEHGDAQQDIDSDPDTNPDNDVLTQDNEVGGNGNEGEDEDDHDVASVTTASFDLALYKVLSAGQPMVVEPGDTVYFTINVVNQGSIAADNIKVTDYVPVGMGFDGTLNPGWVVSLGKYQRTLSVANGSLPAGGLPGGATIALEIALTVDAPLAAGTSLVNFAEISSATDSNGDAQQDVDSTPDANDNNDTVIQDNDIDGNGLAGGDEDDHDYAEVVTEAFDLALYKVLSDGQLMVVEPGDTVHYTIHVVNQGMIAADNIGLADYIPAGMYFDGPLNPGWTFVSGKAIRTLSTANGMLPAGGLAPGTSTSINLQLVVASPLPQGTSLANFAEVTAATDENGEPVQDIDSNPDNNPGNDTYLQDNYIDGNGLAGGDEDDHDGAVVVTEAFDLALIKVLGAGQEPYVEPGDTVLFTIEVLNQGMIAADGILVADYIPDGLNFNAGLNPDWNATGYGAVTALTVAGGELPAGGLAPGATVTVDIYLVVDNPINPGVGLLNFAEIVTATDENGAPQVDIDSHPDNNPGNDTYLQDNEVSGNGNNGEDEDDHDGALVTTEVFDLALTKRLKEGQNQIVYPSDTLTFEIEVFNQGQVAADNISVVDYVPDGYLFSAALNPAWVVNASGYPETTISVAEGELPAGGLQPGFSYIIEIRLIVDPAVEQGQDLLNFAEVSGATDDEGHPEADIDSTPDDDPDNDTFVNDNETTGNGMLGGDEDDHDPAFTDVACYKSPGEDTDISVCLGCAAAQVIVDFFGSLEGNPWPGGYWTDLDGSGLDLSDPSMVVVTGLEPGFYRFRYTIPGVNNCPSKSAILTLEVVSIENLVCNANVNISLGESCEAEVSVDNILEGDLPCYTDLEVHIINLQGNDIGNVVNSNHIGQTLFVKVVDPMCDNHCWGTIKVEDKKAPVIDCPDNTNQGTVSQEVHQISGELMPADESIQLANYSCFIETAVPQAGGHYYDLIPFQVNVDDYYTFQMISSWGDGSAAVYAGSFDESQPCQNMIAQQDDSFNGGGGVSFDPLFSITLPLRAGQVYYLFTSSWEANQTGDYIWNVYSGSGNGWLGSWDTTYITNQVDWSVDTVVSFNGLPTTTLSLTNDLICTDIDQILNNPASLAYTGAATAEDNCTNNVSITFADAIFGPNGDCDETVILRTFTATDGSGNTDECVQEIRVRKATLADVNLPPITAVLECDESFPTLANGNPSPEVTGYPSIRTAFGVYPLRDDFCNIGAIYEDQTRISVCEGAYKFIRHWVVLDWCTGGGNLSFDQVIKVGDFTPPTVSGPEADYDWDGEPDVLTYSTGPFSCVASFDVPLPEVSDNCSAWEVLTEVLDTVLVDVYNQYGLLTGQVVDTVTLAVIPFNAPSRIVNGIPAGENLLRYTVRDDCGNKVIRYVPFVVKDLIEPSAVCNDDLHVSIGGGDYARIYAEDIDEGSTDNCGIASIDVRRDKFDIDGFTCGDGWSEWGEYVDFFCCDAGDTITIEMRVTDFDGNENICWLTVVPEEKVRPYCYAPHEVSVGCDSIPYGFDPEDLSQLAALFGEATAEDNCGATVEELAPAIDLECGFGTIIRRFRAVDIHGNQSNNFCQQVVTIEEVHNYEIRFPADASAVCGEAEPDTVTVNEIGCDLLAISHTDEFYSASGDECYKIFRTWRVVNWCQYDGESNPVVIGRDEDCDNQPGDEAVWVLHRPNGYTYIDRDNDETEPNNVPLAYQNICWGIDDFWRKVDYDGGYFEYLQIIKVYDDIDPEVTFQVQDAFCSYDNAECTGLVTYPFTIIENCTPNDLTIKVFLDANDDGNLDGEITAEALDGGFPDYKITGSFPIGNHRFEVHVKDGCGNSTSVDIPFEVIDCKAPAPTCINGLATELMPFDSDGDGIFDEGRMTVWASDFIVSPMDDCSGPVTYSVNRLGEAANVDSTAIVLSCADTGNLVVEVWAWDAAGNSDYCETYIQVQDNFGICADGQALLAAGSIATETNSMVEDVEVTLSGEGFDVMMTGANGWYGFSGLQEGYDYTVTPMRDGDYLNGVSTYDLVVISKHILGVAPLNSPYKIIAADVNNSHTVTTLDMIMLRKLILSIDTQFSSNTSWRFIERAYVFPNPANPWQEDFPEVVSINNLPAAGLSNADFVAVKVGDVTLDAVTNSAMAVEQRDMDGVFYLETADESLKAGNTYTVAFTAGDMAGLEGYQATLSFDREALELVDIVEGVAKSDNFGLRYLGEGLITTSWNGNTAQPQGAVMFSLVFRATADAQLSELLSVNSRVTKAEAYRTGGRFQDVALRFSGKEGVDAGFELYQNRPNPFREETVISFRLPQAEQVVVTISDVNGRMLKLIRLDGVKGYNELTLKRGSLPSGVLSYTVKAGAHTATKMMVCTE